MMPNETVHVTTQSQIYGIPSEKMSEGDSTNRPSPSSPPPTNGL